MVEETDFGPIECDSCHHEYRLVWSELELSYIAGEIVPACPSCGYEQVIDEELVEQFRKTLNEH
jgi:hypothetical protein